MVPSRFPKRAIKLAACHNMLGNAAVALLSEVGASSSTTVNDATPSTAPDHTDTSGAPSNDHRGASFGLLSLSLADTTPLRDATDGNSLAPLHPLPLPATCQHGHADNVITVPLSGNSQLSSRQFKLPLDGRSKSVSVRTVA